MADAYGERIFVGQSTESVIAAMQNAVDAAQAAGLHVEWLAVDDTRGRVEGGRVAVQVVLRVGYTLE